ncbi:MAG: hypothetical protein CVV30_01300 [Methanomicrobiales archaeon HGW-Methanomicrobiales-1]|jgi:hypothetical protein|nr:MAG: hypothetical protein CVV30_01300 [Methanomicrobiales archaeon HGW-Methanomicrobiales-1]
MEYGKLLDDALHYTNDGIFSNVNRWMKLIVAIICLGIPMNGYVMRIYRGTETAPEVDQWGTLFVDGIKLIIVGIIYAIPIMILWAFIYGGMMLSLMQGNTAMMQNWSPNLGLLLLMYLIEIIIGIIMPVAAIRFARTGSFSEAFNFSAILATIKQIGWLNYIIALILIAIVICIPVFIIIFAFILIGGISMYMLGGGMVALFGFIAAAILVLLVLMPLFGVFQARYMTRVYDSAAIET